jgi:NADH:ubiquinone oxidoreductase subunit 2 (subunit N)
MSILAPSLEIAVLILGVLLLLFEAFAEKIDKRTFAFTAMLGLAAVFVASFFVVPAPTEAADAGFWSFYAADPLAIFFKRFALVTTILVLAITHRSCGTRSMPLRRRPAWANFSRCQFLPAPD